MINYKFDDKDIQKMSLYKDLKAANYEVDKETGEATFSHKFQYCGTLEFYFETGMEGLASIVHDHRGWKEEHSWNNETKENDGPLKEYKSLEWAVFLRGGEFLRVYKNDILLWEGLLFRDALAMKNKHYSYHFLPLDISFEDWLTWCKEEYFVEVFTNEPVLAENEEYKQERRNMEILNDLVKVIKDLGFTKKGSRTFNEGSSFEVTVSKDSALEEKLKDLGDIGNLFFDGYSETADSYKIIYCKKSVERLLKEKLSSHLTSLGFSIINVAETSPNKGFIFSVKKDNNDALKTISNFENLILDGFTERGDFNDIFYVFPKED